MKKPPSASVKPPNQTTQRVPTRSSKPGGADGRGGGIAVLPPMASFAPWISVSARDACSASAMVAGGSAAIFGDEASGGRSDGCCAARRGRRGVEGDGGVGRGGGRCRVCPPLALLVPPPPAGGWFFLIKWFCA